METTVHKTLNAQHNVQSELLNQMYCNTFHLSVISKMIFGFYVYKCFAFMYECSTCITVT